MKRHVAILTGLAAAALAALVLVGAPSFAAPNRQTSLPADVVLSITRTADQWTVTTDGAAWEIKYMEPGPQQILCGTNYGKPCQPVTTFTATGDCVYLQVDWQGQHNSSDPYICVGSTPTPTETSWENTLPTSTARPTPTLPVQVTPSSAPTTMSTSTPATPTATSSAEPPLPTQTSTPTPSASGPVASTPTPTSLTTPSFSPSDTPGTAFPTSKASTDSQRQASPDTEANATLPQTGDPSWFPLACLGGILLAAGIVLAYAKKHSER